MIVKFETKWIENISHTLALDVWIFVLLLVLFISIIIRRDCMKENKVFEQKPRRGNF